MRRVLVPVLVLTLAPGCTSLHTVHREPANPFEAIRVGDVVNVHTSDGRQNEFKVAQILPAEIVGTDGQRYRASEITRLQRRTVSGGKTAALGAGIGLGLLLIYGFMYAIGISSIASPQ
jgi:hypothetical protein